MSNLRRDAVRINLHFPPQLGWMKGAIEEFARLEGMTANGWVRRALLDAINRRKEADRENLR